MHGSDIGENTKQQNKQSFFAKIFAKKR